MNSVPDERQTAGHGNPVMRVAAWAIALASLLASNYGYAEQARIKLITERSPFTHVSAADPSGGEATLFTEQLLSRAGIAYELFYLPWRRAYNEASTEANIVIFPLAKTTQRQGIFRWVGQLIPVNYYLFRLKSRTDIVLSTLNDARPYRIGVVNYHVHHEPLLEQGFTELQTVNSNVQNLKKALLDRIDLFPISDGGLMQLCVRETIDCSKFEPVLKLEDISGGLHIAFSPSVSDEMVEAARESYRQLLEDGTHARIFKTRLDYVKEFNRLWPMGNDR